MTPATWTDHLGVTRKVPQTKWRLSFSYPSHRALRAFVMIRDAFTCQDCGTVADRQPSDYDGADLLFSGRRYLVIDHKISRCRGKGCTHHPDNLQVLCESCNTRKRNLVDTKRGEACPV